MATVERFVPDVNGVFNKMQTPKVTAEIKAGEAQKIKATAEPVYRYSFSESLSVSLSQRSFFKNVGRKQL